MSRLALGILACATSVFGIIFNAYIVLVLVYNRQTRTANSLLLLHLALVDILTCLETLSMTTPAAIDECWGERATCNVHGFAQAALLPIALWTLCGLNGDRYAAIASPLHYSRLVRSRRVALFLAFVWLLGVALAMPPLFRGIHSYSYQPGRAACAPDFADLRAGPWYPLAYATLSLLLPAFLILLCNLRILVIARHHRHRIVSAIYEVTVRAQATITHQRNPFYLSKYKGRCAVVTIVQLVGSVLLLYGPQCGLLLWEMTSGRAGPPLMASITTGLLASSPLLNGFVYGVKSRALRKAFKSFLRRRLYTSEVHNEIQRRGSTGANHAWSYVLLRIQKNSGALMARPIGATYKCQSYSPEACGQLPDAYISNHASTGIGLAGLGLTLGIGLSDSDSGDSCQAPPAMTPDLQHANTAVGMTGSVESVLLSKDGSPVNVGLQPPKSTDDSELRQLRDEAVPESHASSSSAGSVLVDDSHSLTNGAAHLINFNATDTSNNHSSLPTEVRSTAERQICRSLTVLSNKNGYRQLQTTSCGSNLELLPSFAGKTLRTNKNISSLFSERGSI